MKVFLIGYMGSGKSSTGPHLATELGLSYSDLDAKIEEEEGMSIEDIFRSAGEDRFRLAEHRILTEFCASPDSFVLACGGGTPLFFDNLDRMNQSGITVYLKVGEDELVGRLLADRNNRPLLAGRSDGELQQWIRSHFRLREPKYEECHIVWEETEDVESLIRRIRALK